jgi:DNA uptake protein ComE-like DNA-binding protein
MAIDNKFRINELISKGSRAIVSKDEQTGTHTFIQGSKEVVNDPYPHLKGERDGETTGRIEKPKYDQEQLKKAVDTKVDELIAPPKKPQPEVVPKELYDDLRRQYQEALARINELESENSSLKSEIERLKSELESLKIQLDAAKLQQTVAENRAQQTQQQYTDLLGDFSQAIIKSTKEGIERVSMEAQVRGLQAQKESLKNQIDSLNLIVGQLRTQVEQQNIRQASESALDGQPGSYDEIGNVGYKIPQGEFTKQDKSLYIETENADRILVKQGTGLNLYNFNEEPTTFTITVKGGATKFLEAPTTITLPARVDAKPGVGYITFRWKPLGRTSPRKSTTSGTVDITASTGESFSIKADYKKEVRRSDRWRAFGSTSTTVGSEL